MYCSVETKYRKFGTFPVVTSFTKKRIRKVKISFKGSTANAQIIDSQFKKANENEQNILLTIATENKG